MSLIKVEEANMDQVISAIYNLYKTDKILADAELTRFSIDYKQQASETFYTEFSLCSDRFFTRFPKFTIDNKGRVISK